MTSNNRRIAAIDLGSNSFHLLLAEMVTRGGIDSPRIIKRVKQKVRLADGFDASRNISQQGIDRAKACLNLFHDEIVQFGASTVKAVATAAMRQANNQSDVLLALETALKFPIEIISGLREAELIYAGVTSTARSRGDTLVIDIGGASTEIIAGHDKTPSYCTALIWVVSYFKIIIFLKVLSLGVVSSPRKHKCVINSVTTNTHLSALVGNASLAHRAPSERCTKSLRRINKIRSTATI